MPCRLPPNVTVASHRTLLLVLALGVASAAPAQTGPDPAPRPPDDGAAADPAMSPALALDLVIVELETRRSAAEADASLPDDGKSVVLELFSRAIEERRKAAGTAAETATLAAHIESSQQRIDELTRLSEEPAPAPVPARYDAVPLDELTARAQDGRQALAEAREALTAHEKALAELNAIGPTLGEAVADAKTALRELRREEKEPPPNELPVMTVARNAYRAGREANLRAAIAQAELKLANYDTLIRLATLERDAVARLVPRLDAEREVLVKAVEARRTAEARVTRVEAQIAAAATASLPLAVTRLATDNAKLRAELEAVTLDTARVAERLRSAERRASELEGDLASIRERVKTVGATETVGRVLRRRLRAFDGLDTSRARERARADAILRATERRIDLGEQRRELADTQAQVDAVLASVPEAERAGVDEARLRDETTTLMTARRAAIDELREAYGRFLTELTSHDAAERHLAATAEAMIRFIRRELLWIRSLPPVSPSDLAAIGAAVTGLPSRSGWRRAFDDARAAGASRPWLSALALLFVIALIVLRPWARRRLAAVGELTGRIRTDAFRHTIVALLMTVMLASAGPLLFTYLGWQLGGAADAAPFSRDLSVVLEKVGLLLILFTGVRWVVHPSGLAARHFGWPESIRAKLLRELGWLTPVTIGCAALWIYAERGSVPELGRYALIVFSAATGIFFWRLFRRDGPLMTAARGRYPDMLGTRTWLAWFPLLVALPAANLVAAAVGYAYTARVVARLLIETGYLVFGLWVVRDVMLRWFTVAERRLRYERALALREEVRAERERHQHEGGEAAAPELAEIEQPKLDLHELGDQGRAVVQGAVLLGVLLSLWAMWAQILPALNVLDDVHLPFTRAALVDGLEQRVAVTASDAAVALLAIAATLFAARNLSGLLGFTLFRRLALDPGAQYAIVTLCQYALVGGGFLYAISALGMQWSKLQWLVAALGVGLGFGLQEIVANFVSGIILLLERPVRVGDFVTVGDATGTVARIRIRATTIVDLDRKEMVLPNKEFITGRVLNWTLSSKVVRVVIPVGVAYGSDPRRARELMLEAAAEDEHVLEDPVPSVMFRSFGDNALGLELRAYVASMDHYPLAITSLHDAIYEKFIEAGITISFPQRDVHLDTDGTLDVRVIDGNAGQPARRWWRGPPGRRR